MPDTRLLAVYGSLLRGMGAQESLGIEAQLEFVRTCVLPGRLYDLGEYPGLRLSHERAGDRTRGELYQLANEATLARLDAFEGYEPDDPARSLFVRRAVRLLDPPVSCWVYLYNRRVDDLPVVASGDWRHHRALRRDASDPGRGQATDAAEGRAKR